MSKIRVRTKISQNNKNKHSYKFFGIRVYCHTGSIIRFRIMAFHNASRAHFRVVKIGQLINKIQESRISTVFFSSDDDDDDDTRMPQNWRHIHMPFLLTEALFKIFLVSFLSKIVFTFNLHNWECAMRWFYICRWFCGFDFHRFALHWSLHLW